jgi:hypothetical protein
LLNCRVLHRLGSCSAALLLGALLVSGCGTASSAADPQTVARARRVATTFVSKYLDAPNKREALRRIHGLASPVFLERAPSAYSAIYGRYRERAVAGPRAGCRRDLLRTASDELCFTIYVVSKRVMPDKINQGYASFTYGLMFVSMTVDGRRVEDVSYIGGARECKLGENCLPARRDALASAKKFEYPVNFRH